MYGICVDSTRDASLQVKHPEVVTKVTRCSRQNGLDELHHAKCNLYVSLLWTRAWLVRSSRASRIAPNHFGNLGISNRFQFDLAQAFSLWTTRVAMANIDIYENPKVSV